MKKSYIKPELNIVSYKTNETFCTGCVDTDLDLIALLTGVSASELANFAFNGSEDACKTNIPDGNPDIENYCKFTYGIKIFTS